MERRTFLNLLGSTAGALSLMPEMLRTPEHNALAGLSKTEVEAALHALSDEPPCQASVRTERGAPRLFLNDQEVSPLFALSTSLLPTIDNFRKMGINLIQPVLGMRSAWTGPDTYDFTLLDDFLARLLTLHPEAYFFPRVQLHAPSWWKETHPDELIKYALPYSQASYDVIKKKNLKRTEGGHYWVEMHNEMYAVSFASRKWKEDTAKLLEAYINHIEQSPLNSRMMGYFIVQGRTSEWNVFGGDALPDVSKPMEDAAGPIPTVRERMYSSYGMLRDPAEEGNVIDFYQAYHQTIAQTVADLAKTVKRAMNGRVLCGTFFGYVMESPRAQEGGYLAPQAVLDSPDIDLIACPNSYQATNDPEKERWESDMYDGAGNWLGRARGVAGDGGFRAMLASIHRRGKLYVAEVDPSTYLDIGNSWRGIGGSGSETREGTHKIIRRDLGKSYAEGVGGWFLDFGPMHEVENGWYGDAPIIEDAAHIARLMDRRKALDLSSIAQIAVAADTNSFFATKHWLSSRPWPGQGIRYTDFFNHWFLNAQARSLHRVGAPFDLLHRFDFNRDDAHKYKLVLFPNAYLLSPEEVEALHDALRGSGMTAVWYYAPGLLQPDRIAPEQMKRLTGFTFQALDDPGPLMIKAIPEVLEKQTFGVMSPHYYHPRFSVQDEEAEVLGHWTTPRHPAFARKAMDGWTSVYVGTAPLPVEVLRWLAQEAGAMLWTNKPAIVSATRSTAMVVATEPGSLSLSLPYPMAAEDGTPPKTTHSFDLEFGEVRLFIGKA